MDSTYTITDPGITEPSRKPKQTRGTGAHGRPTGHQSHQAHAPAIGGPPSHQAAWSPATHLVETGKLLGPQSLASASAVLAPGPPMRHGPVGTQRAWSGSGHPHLTKALV